MSLIITVLFICAPFISIPLLILGLIKDKKHKIVYGILLAIILAIIAYNFIPKEQHDLYRYYFENDCYYANINFERFVREVMFNNSKFLFVILQYIVAQIGNNRILPFIITFIGYSLIFYIIIDFSKIKQVKPIVTVGVLAFFVLTFYHINFMSGLAQGLSIVLSFLAFYMEYIKGKKKWYYKILYIIPVFIHLSMVAMLFLRVVLQFRLKGRGKICFILILILYTVFPNIIYQILNVIPGMTMIANKINSYVLNANSIFISVYDIATLCMLIFSMVIYYTSKKQIKDEFNKNFLKFMEIVMLFNLFSILYRDIFSRTFNISLLSMCLYLLVYIDRIKTKKSIFIIIGLIFFSIALGSVNLNNILVNNYNDIFSNITQNVFFYFI